MTDGLWWKTFEIIITGHKTKFLIEIVILNCTNKRKKTVVAL